MKMKSPKEKEFKDSEKPVVAYRIEITELNREYFVTINGLPLNRPHSRELARFSTSRNAFRAANMAIARERRGFLV